MTDLSVNKTESLVSGQEIDLLDKACTQASSEQRNGVTTGESLTKHTDEVGLLKSPVAQQGESDKPVGPSASTGVFEKTVYCLEVPKASSEEPTATKRAVQVEEQTKKMAVGSKEFIDQKSEHTPVQRRIFKDTPGPVYGPPKVNQASVVVEALDYPWIKKSELSSCQLNKLAVVLMQITICNLIF